VYFGLPRRNYAIRNKKQGHVSIERRQRSDKRWELLEIERRFWKGEIKRPVPEKDTGPH
jgi:hypothetical protein